MQYNFCMPNSSNSFEWSVANVVKSGNKSRAPKKKFIAILAAYILNHQPADKVTTILQFLQQDPC